MSWLRGSFLARAAFAAASLAVAFPADARVKREGAWPDADKPITLDVKDTPRDEALRRLADAAGWSLVVRGDAVSKELVDLHLKQQPAGKVLDLLLDDEDYVAKRDGTLVSIVREDDSDEGSKAMPPMPPAPPVPPSIASAVASAMASAHAAPSAKGITVTVGSDSSEIEEPHGRGKDRTVMGGDVRIAKGEVARDVTVFGGNVDIEGEATGDVTVFGGNVRVHEGARVHGDATVFGGTLALAPGAKVDGDVSALGGTLKREPGSQIGGDVNAKGSDSDSEASDSHTTRRSAIARAGESIMDGVRLAAVLFVIGTVLLALAGRRMESLRFEVAARPMRTLALGLVGLLGSIVVLIALCVTVIGIPIALVAVLLGVLGMFGAMCAVLSVVGEALLRHRTTNQYVHLAVGCAIFVALSALPWVGGFVGFITALAGIGTLVATRGAGYFVKRNGGGTPYRSVPPEAPVA